MKCIVKLSFAAVLVASMVCSAWATTGDNIFFSTTNSLTASMSTLTGGSATPANISVNYSSLGQDTLYVWVTSVAGDDITPPDTTITPTVINSTTNYVPGSAASISLNYNVTAGTSVNFSGAASDGAQNFAGSWANSGVAANATGSDVNTNNRATVWSSVSNFTFSGNPSNVTGTGVSGVTSTVTPTVTTGLTATSTNRGFSLTQADGTVGANQQLNSTAGAFLLGSVTFSAASTGSSTLQIGLGSAGIFRGGDGTGTITDPGNKGAAYNYFNAAINISTGRLGDLNGDGAINALDIDILGADLNAGATFATKPQDDTNGDHVVNTADLNHLVGSLVDINGGGVGGAHGTHFGDLDLSGQVFGNDLGVLLQHLGSTGAAAIWANGNLYNSPVPDTLVGGADLGLLLQNLGQTGASGQLSTVPEPASCVLLGLGALSMLGVVRRRSR